MYIYIYRYIFNVVIWLEDVDFLRLELDSSERLSPAILFWMLVSFGYRTLRLLIRSLLRAHGPDCREDVKEPAARRYV